MKNANSQVENLEAFYTIKEIEKLTGIKAHTIRIWEKRYNIIEPHRTDTNIRRYDESALKKILLVSSLNNSGIKISKLAMLDFTELQTKFNEIASEHTEMEMFVDQLVISMIELDEKSFSQLLDDFSNWFGFEKTVIDIFFPFFEKVGIMWLINKIHPAHEHFISNIIRLKIFSEINKIPIQSTYSKPTVILFLKEGEFHELGLIFYHYLFRVNGFKTIYLGQNLPTNDLLEIAQFHDAEILVTALVTKLDDDSTQSWLDSLSKSFPSKNIIISGQQSNDSFVEFPSNIFHINTVAELSLKIKEEALFEQTLS